MLPPANEIDDAIERVRKIFELQKVSQRETKCLTHCSFYYPDIPPGCRVYYKANVLLKTCRLQARLTGWMNSKDNYTIRI